MTQTAEKAVNFSLRRDFRTTEKALNDCTAHPLDPEVLITRNSTGLAAGKDPHVKAVIWEQGFAEGVDILGKMSAEDVNFFVAFTAYNASRAIISEEGKITIPEFPQGGILMKEHMGPRLLDVFSSVVVRAMKAMCPENNPEFGIEASGFFDNYPQSTRQPHIDLSRKRLHIACQGKGLQWFAGPVFVRDYETSFNSYAPCSTFTNEGDVTFMKGSKSNHDVPEGYVAGLLHKTPDPSPAEEQALRDGEPVRRLYFAAEIR